MPITLFCCYTQEDEALLSQFKTHLRLSQRQSPIASWYDRDISAGTEWEQEISKHLNTAQIILLLVSPAFLNSDYCSSIEMKRAIERHERKEARVIPIRLDYVYWQIDPLNKLPFLPSNGKPVMSASWDNLNEALVNVTEGIHKMIKQLVSPPLAVEKLAMLRILTGHEDAVCCVAISPDGQRLFSGGLDRTIKVWNLSTGKEIRTLTGHDNGVYCVAISPDGQRLVSGSEDNTIKVWNLSTGREMRTLIGHTSLIKDVAISPDRRTLVSASADETIKVWNLSTGKEIRTLIGHRTSARNV
jgi:TIR domain/WD domain, G-beta repeat